MQRAQQGVRSCLPACLRLQPTSGTSISVVLPRLRTLHGHLRDHPGEKAYRYFYMHVLIATYVARVIDDLVVRSRRVGHRVGRRFCCTSGQQHCKLESNGNALHVIDPR